MKKSQKIWLGVLIAILVTVCGLMLYKSTEKVVYIEYQRYGELCETPLDMCSNAFVIEQELEVPYDMFYGLSFRIGTYGRENNSRYELIITDKTENKVVKTEEFNVSQATDDKYYEVFFDSPIKLEKDHKFSATIKAKSLIDSGNGVGFFVDNGKENANSGDLYYNGAIYDGNLCMNVYGGDTNSFWFVFTLICEIYVVSLIIYILYLAIKKKDIKKNTFVQAGIVGVGVFLLMFAFTGLDSFSDEVDNMVGGMLIKNGAVLYVDYYSGHTPFAYLLSAVFAMFGAASEEQFRLIYFALISIIYAGLFIRHKKNFGATKMAILPIIQIIFCASLDERAMMLLSDNIQAICMVALALEFLQYLKDEKLDWSRSIIVSLSIWCSFGSAFVSVYGIFAICLGVFIKEILYWAKNKSLTFKNLVLRYRKLVIACVIPFVVALGYFVATHSLVEFYQQAYQFNTDVYSVYLADGYGSNIFQPFFIGIYNFIHVIARAMESMASKKIITEAFVEFVMISIFAAMFVILINMLRKKEFLKAIIITLFISFNFTRDNEVFHTSPAWAVMLTVILLEWDIAKFANWHKNSFIVIVGIGLFCAINIYSNLVTGYLFKEKEPVLELAQKVVQETEEGEEIFLDIFSDVKSSTYLIYKNRIPSNKLMFILPWYMDWFEYDTVQELATHKPKIVIYDEDAKVWEISGYDDYLQKYLHENYNYLPGNKKVWILK